MPGKVLAVNIKPGDSVTKGQALVVLEAMKMEHALTAPRDGVIAEVSVRGRRPSGRGRYPRHAPPKKWTRRPRRRSAATHSFLSLGERD